MTARRERPHAPVEYWVIKEAWVSFLVFVLRLSPRAEEPNGIFPYHQGLWLPAGVYIVSLCSRLRFHCSGCPGCATGQGLSRRRSQSPSIQTVTFRSKSRHRAHRPRFDGHHTLRQMLTVQVLFILKKIWNEHSKVAYPDRTSSLPYQQVSTHLPPLLETPSSRSTIFAEIWIKGTFHGVRWVAQWTGRLILCKNPETALHFLLSSLYYFLCTIL